MSANQKIFLIWLGVVALFAASSTDIGWDISTTREEAMSKYRQAVLVVTAICGTVVVIHRSCASSRAYA